MAARPRTARDHVVITAVHLDPDGPEVAWVEAESENGCVRLRWRTPTTDAPRVGQRLELAIKEQPGA